MRSRHPSPEHQEAVHRRLALLSEELGRVRAAELEDEPPTLGEPEFGPAPMVPTPGRHAARRVGRVVLTAVPETLRGRVALGQAQLAVVAVLVAVGLGLTCWWIVRGDPELVAAPTLTAPSSGLVAAPSAPADPVETAGGTVTVDVAGKVRRPGIAVLDAGARVIDALQAAGGARRGVDLSGLNLARLLVDGEQVVVGVPAPAGVAASAVPQPGASGGPLVNLNTASQTELESLPEVGPVTATAIITFRTEHGGFTSVDQLLDVDGIGEATLGQIAPHVTV